MTQRDEREKLAEKVEQAWPLYLENDEQALIVAALRTPADGEAHAEIQRLQDAKRRALALADERAKENVELRAALEKIACERPMLLATQMRAVAVEALSNATEPAQGAAITDAMVNAAAREMWNDRDARHGGSWDSRDPREVCVIQTKATAKAALIAALRPTAPEPADTDEGPDPLGYAKGERA